MKFNFSEEMFSVDFTENPKIIHSSRNLQTFPFLSQIVFSDKYCKKHSVCKELLFIYVYCQYLKLTLDCSKAYYRLQKYEISYYSYIRFIYAIKPEGSQNVQKKITKRVNEKRKKYHNIVQRFNKIRLYTQISDLSDKSSTNL